jgi:DNA-binding LacI/PurR family transcriptional regulator
MEMAERMGYTPDPMLSSLASYRGRKAPAKFRSVLPWLHLDENLGGHREDLPWGQLLKGARERAERTGFKLETHWVGGGDVKPARFLSMLQARGVAGAICGPGIEASEWIREFVNAPLPIVGVGTYPLGEVSMPHVSADHYLNAALMTGALRGEGFQRVLVVLNKRLEQVLLRQYEAYFQREATAGDSDMAWKICVHRKQKSPEAARALTSFRPDAVVLSGVDQYREFLELLSEAQRKRFLATPVGLLCHSDAVEHPAPLISVNERLEHIGATAVDQLAVAITNWHLESAHLPRRVLVEGEIVRRDA